MSDVTTYCPHCGTNQAELAACGFLGHVCVNAPPCDDEIDAAALANAWDDLATAARNYTRGDEDGPVSRKLQRAAIEFVACLAAVSPNGVVGAGGITNLAEELEELVP